MNERYIKEKLETSAAGVVYSTGFVMGDQGNTEGLHTGFEPGVYLTPQETGEVLNEGMPKVFQKDGVEVFAEPFYPMERMLIFGGGHVAKSLSVMAKMLGFYVVVCDEREEFANQERFPQADEVHIGEFSKTIQKLHPRFQDYCVIVTRGHSEDATCLRALFEYEETVYTGLIGSKKRTDLVKENLVKEGLDGARLERIATPIGLPIGAKTLEEISVSILAEVIQRKRIDSIGTKGMDRSDHDMEVIEALAMRREPRVVATIMETTGSVPRRAGTRMAVFADGSMIGTVGGGSVEFHVIEKCKALMGSGQYEVFRIDLNGKDAMAAGMVCGGYMQILIQAEKSE